MKVVSCSACPWAPWALPPHAQYSTRTCSCTWYVSLPPPRTLHSLCLPSSPVLSAVPTQKRARGKAWDKLTDQQKQFCLSLRKRFSTDPTNTVANGLIVYPPDPCIAHFGPTFNPAAFTIRPVCLWDPPFTWPSAVPTMPCPYCRSRG